MPRSGMDGFVGLFDFNQPAQGSESPPLCGRANFAYAVMETAYVQYGGH